MPLIRSRQTAPYSGRSLRQKRPARSGRCDQALKNWHVPGPKARNLAIRKPPRRPLHASAMPESLPDRIVRVARSIAQPVLGNHKGTVAFDAAR